MKRRLPWSRVKKSEDTLDAIRNLEYNTLAKALADLFVSIGKDSRYKHHLIKALAGRDYRGMTRDEIIDCMQQAVQAHIDEGGE